MPSARSVRWLLLAASAFSGVLIGASFIDFRLYALAWVAFAPLLWAIDAAPSFRQAVLTAAIAGIVTNILGFHWLVYTINVFGGFPYPVAVFFFACFVAYSAVQFVLFAAALRRIGWGPLGLAPAVLWTAIEFLYPNLFPWRMAHTQHHVVPLIQIGDLTGPYSLSALLVWASTALVMLRRVSGVPRRRRFGPVVGVAITVAAFLGYGTVRISQVSRAVQSAPVVQVALVQGNVGVKEKRDVRYFEVNVERYRELTAAVQDHVALVIWPETVSQVWVRAGKRVLEGDEQPFPGLQTRLMFGGLSFDVRGPGEVAEFNSAFLVGPQGQVLGRYDKRILMPFGEYLPFAEQLPWIKQISPYSGGFTPGRGTMLFDIPGIGRFAPLICFEDLPAGIPRAATRAGAAFLVAIANDAWYGESAAPYEHQALALWRAIENRRYLLRVNNTGVTGVIDPLGQVSGALPIFTENVLIASVHPLELTSLYTRFGDVFGWVIVGLSTILLIRRRGPSANRSCRASAGTR